VRFPKILTLYSLYYNESRPRMRGGPSRNQVRPLAIAAVLPGKLDNIGCETLLVVTTVRDLALRRAMLPERRTGATLGDMQRAALIALRTPRHHMYSRS
jgi:hypothetical protein